MERSRTGGRAAPVVVQWALLCQQHMEHPTRLGHGSDTAGTGEGPDEAILLPYRTLLFRKRYRASVVPLLDRVNLANNMFCWSHGHGPGHVTGSAPYYAPSPQDVYNNTRAAPRPVQSIVFHENQTGSEGLGDTLNFKGTFFCV